jgi:tetratricopeptide (TPR) repeat protein
MRRFLPILASALLPLLFVLQAASQSSSSAADQPPDALTALYTQAMQAKDWSGAVAAAEQLVALQATSLNLKLLGDAQLYSGLPYAALATYDKAVAAAEKEKPADGQPLKEWNNGLAQILIAKGNALLKLKLIPDALQYYSHAAPLASNAGLAYFNVCAVLYNIGNPHESAAACRKCVEADPTRANAWFILGSDLFADAPVDANGKITAMAATREALEKYLALAPDGPHAADVKAMLEMIEK